MSILTTRAEQGLLGALLADNAVGDELAAAQVLLEAGDFGHRAHQQVWTALVDLDQTRPGLRGQELLTAVAQQVTAPGADRAWLQRLQGAGATHRHLPAYIRMIQTAALRRDIAAAAERLTHGGGSPDLAAALRQQAEANRAVTADTADPGHGPPLNGTPSATQNSAPEPTAPAVRDQVPVDAGVIRPRDMREDLLLADLLRHPEQAAELARVFPAESLTDPQRREVYRTIVSLAVDGDSVDEVVVAVNLEQQRAYNAYLLTPQQVAAAQPPVDITDPGTEPAPAYLARLAQLGVDTTTNVVAVEIARDLITDDVRTRVTVQAPKPIPATGRPTVQPPGSRPEPVRQAEAARQAAPLQPPQHRPAPPHTPGPAPRMQP